MQEEELWLEKVVDIVPAPASEELDLSEVLVASANLVEF